MPAELSSEELDLMVESELARHSQCTDCNRKELALLAREALAHRKASAWRPIAEAPKDGTRFLAIHNKKVRVVAWGKTSHLPWQGFCLADQGAEDFDLIDGLHLWMPFPPVDGAE